MTARRRIGVLEGALVVAALGCVPLALAAALRAPVVESLHGLVDALVVLAAVTWVTVTVGLGRLVVHRVRGGAVEPGPMGWAAVRVAAVVLLVAPFLDSSTGVAAPHRSSPGGDVAGRGAIATAVAAPSHTVSSATPADRAVRWARRPHGARCRHARSTPALLGTGVLLVALAADARRRSRLSRRVGLDTAAAVDLETALLAGRAAPWPRLASVASALGACGRLDAAVHLVLAHGEAALADGTWRFDPATGGAGPRDPARRAGRCRARAPRPPGCGPPPGGAGRAKLRRGRRPCRRRVGPRAHDARRPSEPRACARPSGRR